MQGVLDAASIGLDASGVGAVVSWVPDLLNAGISAGRGDWVGAALSASAIPPVFGTAVNGTRLLRTLTKGADKAGDTVRAADKTIDAGRSATRGGGGAGSGASDIPSRAQRREAMRQAGVPTSQQPKVQSSARGPGNKPPGESWSMTLRREKFEFSINCKTGTTDRIGKPERRSQVVKPTRRVGRGFGMIRFVWSRAMDSEVKKRLERAKRRQRQKLDLPKFRASVAAIIPLSADFEVLDVEESISLEEQLYGKLRQMRASAELSIEEGLNEEQFVAYAAHVLAPDAEAEFLVFLCHWGHIGAIRISGQQLASCVHRLLTFDGDTITACTPQMDRIVSFDVIVEPDGGRRYEVDDWRESDSRPM